MSTLQLGCPTPVLHHLVPLTTTSSPSSTAVACMFVASEEATSGSVMQKAERMLPSSSGSSQRRFCSSEPKCHRTSMFPVSGALQLQTSAAIKERPMRSASGAYSTLESPAPPFSSGRNRFHRPSRFAIVLSSSIAGKTTHGSSRESSSRMYGSSRGPTSRSWKASRRSTSSIVRGEWAKFIGSAHETTAPRGRGVRVFPRPDTLDVRKPEPRRARMDAVNHQFRLAARPQGMVGREHFDYVEEPVPTLGEGQSLVENLYISLDPAMRGWMAEGRSYIPPVEIGEVMRAGTVGRVVETRGQKLAVGDYVSGWRGVQSHAVCDENSVFKIDADAAPLPTYLGALGMPGVTAYFGLLEVGAPKEGETVVVSGAAGAVGSVVGQIAKLKGCRVVGIAGGPEKCGWIADELGFDVAIDYKGEDVGEALREHCPEGIDVYFDNVGGDILDAALARLARGARVVICGAISQYNKMDAMKGPSNYMSLLA